MGLFTILASLIEYLIGEEFSDSVPWERLTPYIYRNFVKLEGEPDTYRWSIDQSQFRVDEWKQTNINENVSIWGELQSSRGKWQLQIQGEDGFANKFEAHYEETYLRDLAERLPQVAQDIIDFVGIQTTEEIPSFAGCTANEASMRELLAHFFYFERNLQLTTWGVIWQDKQSIKDFETLLKLGETVGGEFGAWGVSLMVVRALRPHYREAGGDIAIYIREVLNAFPKSTAPAFLLSEAALQFAKVIDDSSLTRDAFDLMEAEVAHNPHHIAGWEALMDLYSSTGRFRESIDTLQRALEVDCTNECMYLNYAQVLTQAHEKEVKRLPLVLTSTDRNSSAPIIWETIAACQMILDENPKSVEALFHQLKHAAKYKLKADWFWPKFKQLVELDEMGSRIGDLTDFLFVYDVSPAVPILKQAIEKQPTRPDLYYHLAAIHMVAEDRYAAQKCLQEARSLVNDPVILAEIDRAIVIAQNPPEFERDLGELELALVVGINVEEQKLISECGYPVTTEHVDLLEDAIAQVPTFYGGYVLLAAAYLIWEDPHAVLEVLLDGQRCLPDNPNITWFLSAFLWDRKEQETAMEYLNIGLEKNPYSVDLLTMKSLFLFELGEDEQAQILLKKARRIEPRDTFFIHVHDYIIWEREKQK